MAIDLSKIGSLAEAVIFMIWFALTVPKVFMNPLFGEIFFCHEFVAEVFVLANLTFCPGLLQALQAAAPPSIAFFLDVELDEVEHLLDKIWSIYFIVLVKSGFLPLLYIGSATAVYRGTKARWHVYDGQTIHAALPQFVKAALLDGYTYAHKGLLVWTPIPSPANVPMVRLLFVAMEAAFTFFFWAMTSISKDYGMGGCCPWSACLDEIDYEGLCGHSPLAEGVSGNFDLSPEQLTTLAAQVKEKNRVYQAEYHQMEKRLYPGKVKARLAKATLNYRTNSPEKYQAKVARAMAKGKASGKWVYQICPQVCSKRFEYERHCTSSKHKLRVKQARSGHVYNHPCLVCHKGFDKPCQLERHQGTGLHKKAVAALAKAVKLSSSESA
jgi:hypothetical protein